MKTMRTALSALIASIWMMGAAAQTGPMPEVAGDTGFGPCMDGDHGNVGKTKERMAARRARHAKEVHDKLQLNTEQETAWKTMELAMKTQAEHRRLDMLEMEKLTAPERMERMIERMRQHEEAMHKRLDAVRSFYATLGSEQRRIFDRETFAPWKKMSQKRRQSSHVEN